LKNFTNILEVLLNILENDVSIVHKMGGREDRLYKEEIKASFLFSNFLGILTDTLGG